MKKLFLAAFVIGIVMAASMNAGWESATWKDQNPYIIRTCGQEVWLVSKMGPSLESLGLDGIQGSDLSSSAAWKSIDYARSEISRAESAGRDCSELLSIKDPVTLTLCLAIGTTTGQLGSALVCSDGREAFCNALLGSHINQTCSGYGYHWAEAMSYAKEGLETTESRVRTSTYKAEQGMQKILDAGLCDDSYGGSQKQDCMEVFSDFLTMRNGSDSFSAYRTSFYAESWEDAPDFTGYDEGVKSAWVWMIPLADDINERSADLLAEAEGQYQDKRAAALLKLAEAGKRLGQLDAQDVDLIDEAVSSGESGGTIVARYAAISKKTEDAVYSEKTAEKVYGYRGQSYLVSAIVALQESVANAEEVDLEGKRLAEDAAEAVDFARDEADNQIYGAQQILGTEPDPAAKSELDHAIAYFKQGETEDTLGRRYVAFAAAAAHARTAKNYQEEGKTGRQSLLKSDIDRTAAMIASAEKDGLAVAEMKNEFMIYKNEYGRELADGGDPSWMLPMLSEMRISLVSMAKAKYSHLEIQRGELLEQIELSEDINYDLVSEMEQAEQGVVVSGRIDYEHGLGKLGALSADYERIAGELGKSAEVVVAGAIAKSSYVTYELGDVELDSSAELTATVLIYNRYPYGAKSVFLQLPVAYDLLENEIEEGAEYVASANYANKKLNLVLDEVKAYDSFRIVFRKEVAAARITSMEKSEIGMPDGTSEIWQKIRFETDYDGISLIIPSQLTEWSVDGKTGSGRKSGKLEMGAHTLIGSGIMEDTFSMEKKDYRAIPVGPNSEISYDLVITPKRDLDGAEIIISDASSGSESVTDFRVTSYSASVPVDNRKPLVNGMYGFTLGKMEKNKNVTLRVSYSVARTADYLNERIAELDMLGGSPAVRQLIGSARQSLSEGDLRRAVEYVEMASAEMEKEQKAADNEKAKRSRMQLQASTELDGLNSVDYSNVPSELKARLDARKSLLEKAVAWNQAALDGYDAGWLGSMVSAERKKLISDYAKLKKDYLDSTGGLLGDSVMQAMENAFAKLDATGSLEDLVGTEIAFAQVQESVRKNIQSSEIEYSIVLEKARLLADDTEVLVGRYSKEYADSRGGSAAGFLDVDYKPLQKEAKALQNLISKSAGKEELLSKTGQVERMAGQLQLKLDYLKGESERKLASLKSIYAQRKGEMNEGDRKLVEQGLIQYQEQIRQENYAESLDTGAALTAIMNREGGGLDGILLLGGGALVILGILALYLLKGGKGPRLGTEKRMPRRLKSLED